MLLLQFIRLAQTLKYFGYIKFDPCTTDFPEKGCHVIVSAGNNELNFHVKLPNNQMKEGSFKVTRMRCWRVTSSVSVSAVVQVNHPSLPFIQPGTDANVVLVNGDLIMFRELFPC